VTVDVANLLFGLAVMVRAALREAVMMPPALLRDAERVASAPMVELPLWAVVVAGTGALVAVGCLVAGSLIMSRALDR